MAVSASAAFAQEFPRGNRDRHSFWVTEAGYAYSATGACSDHYPSIEVGQLVNLGGSLAAGGALLVGHNADVVWGPEPRLRYWATDRLAVDLAAGLLWGARRVRPTGYLSVNYRDLGSGFVRYERYRDGGCGQPVENQVFIGVKVGSRPAVITAMVGGVIAGIIIVWSISQIEN